MLYSYRLSNFIVPKRNKQKLNEILMTLALEPHFYRNQNFRNRIQMAEVHFAQSKSFILQVSESL